MSYSPKKLDILLGIPLTNDYWRGVIQGIIRFSDTTRWVLNTCPINPDGTFQIPTFPEGPANPAGLIALIETPEAVDQCAALQIPYVNVSSALEQSQIPRAVVDDRNIGNIAAAHFLERRLRNFAFVGRERRIDSIDRFGGFCERLDADGFTNIPIHHAPPDRSAADLKAFSRWISNLPTPVGIFAMDDTLARWVIDACREASITVPSDVAILGCGNDSVACCLSTPSLSSVELPAERVGFEAAQILHELLGKKKPQEMFMRLPVSSVIPRGSTDTVSVNDPDVAAAMRFILAHAGEWIGVRELLLAVSVQRRSLERKFRRILGRSPLEEIRRVRIDLARQLLSGTDLSMPIVARRSGFSEAKQLSMVFRNVVGMTPTDYRARFRLAVPVPEDNEESTGDASLKNPEEPELEELELEDDLADDED